MLAAAASSAVLIACLTQSQAAAQSAPRPRFGVCQRQGVALVGKPPVTLPTNRRAPRKLRDASPRLPGLPAGTFGRGIWIGEVLVGMNGKVARVWPIRELEFQPPFPEFNRAILDAIQRWEFDPPIIDSRPAPLCITVTVLINWR